MMMDGVRGRMLDLPFVSERRFRNPYWDCAVTAVFRHEASGCERRIEGFHDGEDAQGRQQWIVRWLPEHAGCWTCEVRSAPAAEGLEGAFELMIGEGEFRGFLRAEGGQRWPFAYDGGEPAFLLGDTIYNLFGGHYCGVEVGAILDHRRAQGVNYVRARAQVSEYHPETHNSWQVRSCWPWGGSPQWPDFSRLNAAYFRSVDEVMAMLADKDMGAEFIMEAWMLEFPFNDRHAFLPEHEELWIRYLVARYAAYPSLFVWCPANEYEFYPGSAAYHPEADRWFAKLAAMIKACDPYRHPVGAHEWYQKVPLDERLGGCDDLDVYLVQSDWFLEVQKLDRDPSLCLWIDQQVRFHAGSGRKAAMCSEFGYEKTGASTFTLEWHDRFDHHHTRRGQWWAGFSGFPVVHGFNNTWGPHMTLESDSLGAAYLPIYRTFMTEDVRFSDMAREMGVLARSSGDDDEGTAPLCMADAGRTTVAVYFPVAGDCELVLPKTAGEYVHYWYNPRSGERSEAERCSTLRFETPAQGDGADALDSDWTLCVKVEGRG